MIGSAQPFRGSQLTLLAADLWSELRDYLEPVAHAATITTAQFHSITTSLTTVSGTNIDLTAGLGVAFDFNESKISFFNLVCLSSANPCTEVATYDPKTVNTVSYSGGTVFTPGVILSTAQNQGIIATGDGFDVIDYTTPSTTTLTRQIVSVGKAQAQGTSLTAAIYVMENFGYDSAVPLSSGMVPLIISGGDSTGVVSGRPTNALELADLSTGQIYLPDTATQSLFSTTDIDAATVDTTYHVAVLAAEFNPTLIFVDLTKLTLNASAGTYSLPSSAVANIATPNVTSFDHVAVESTNHLLLAAGGYVGNPSEYYIGQVSDPASSLGFVTGKVLTAPETMPVLTTSDTSDGLAKSGVSSGTSWTGSHDPHGEASYVNSSTNESTGLWLNGTFASVGPYIAVINLANVLNGYLTNPTGYNPVGTTPMDIWYQYKP